VSLAEQLVAHLLDGFAWHPELFEHRARMLEALDAAGLLLSVDFESVDILHEEFGIEVCGMPQEPTAFQVLRLMQTVVPDLPVRFHFYQEQQQWVAVAVRDDAALGAVRLKRRKQKLIPVMKGA